MTKPNLKFSLWLRILKILPEFIISRSMQGFYMSDFHNLKTKSKLHEIWQKIQKKKNQKDKKRRHYLFLNLWGWEFHFYQQPLECWKTLKNIVFLSNSRIKKVRKMFYHYPEFRRHLSQLLVANHHITHYSSAWIWNQWVLQICVSSDWQIVSRLL